jgi:hypothetical protein
MKKTVHAILFGFKELLDWNTMKYALVSGGLVTLLWVGIGMLLWDTLMHFSSYVIELVPFSMIRANGAWMLSSFLWLQVVLLTFALIFAFFGNLILRHLSKERYTTFSLVVIAGSALFWGMVWFVKGEYIYQEFLKLLTWLPFETIEKSIAFLIGFYFIYNAIVVTMLFVTSLFSKPLITSVEKRHFHEDEVRRDHLFSSLKYTLKDALIFMVASVVVLPLLFVPIVNIFVQIALWMWLIKDTMSYDAAALVYDKIDTKEIQSHRVALFFISFVVALLNFIPVLHLFSSYFGEIAMFHYLKSLQRN